MTDVMSTGCFFTVTWFGQMPLMAPMLSTPVSCGMNTVVFDGHSANADDRKTMQPPSSDDLAKIISIQLRRAYDGVKHAGKLIARSLQTSPRTAYLYLAGSHPPGGWNLVQLMAQNRELRAE